MKIMCFLLLLLLIIGLTSCSSNSADNSYNAPSYTLVDSVDNESNYLSTPFNVPIDGIISSVSYTSDSLIVIIDNSEVKSYNMRTFTLTDIFTAGDDEHITACAYYKEAVYVAVIENDNPSIIVIDNASTSTRIILALDSSILQICVTDEVIACVSGSNLELFKFDGTKLGGINAQDPPIFGIASLHDTLIVLSYEVGSFYLSKLDAVRSKLIEKRKLPFAIGDAVLYSDGDERLFMRYGYELYEIDQTTMNVRLILDFMSCDIAANGIKALFPYIENSFVCFVIDPTNGYRALNVLSPNLSDDQSKTVLTLAMFSIDSTFLSQVVEFNKQSPDVRIKVVTYDTSDDYYIYKRSNNDGMTKFITDVMSGNIPDIIDVSTMPVKLFANKGMFEDLYPMLDADAELDRAEILPAVLSASEINGKLYNTISRFDLLTAAASVDDSTFYSSQSLAEAMSAAAENDKQFLLSISREFTISLFCAIYAQDFIDWPNLTCNFESDDFAKLLKIAKSQFPDNQSEYFESQPATWMLRYCIVSLRPSLLNQLVDQIGSFVFSGLPTAAGNGHWIQPRGVQLSISAQSKYKSEAWKFLKTMFSEEYQSKFSPATLRSNIAAQNFCINNFIAAQNDPAYSDGLRNYYNMLSNTLNETDKLYVIDVPLYNIVCEETSAYFANDKTAEETARIIQSRASLYIGEQS